MSDVKLNSRHFLLFLLFFQFIFCALIFFDTPIVRQVFGFAYLTFVPGFVIYQLLKLDKLDMLETTLFSVGLSIAFLTFVGLLTNEFGVLFGISDPLSLFYFLPVLNIFIFVIEIAIGLKKEDIKSWKTKISPFTLLLVVFPILSVLGAMEVNIFDSNTVLLLLIVAISVLFIIGILSKKLFTSKLYPLVLLIIAVSLLFHSSLISNYIVSFGSDVPGEVLVFRATENNALWDSTTPFFGDLRHGRINAMLSVTILPTIFSTLLNIDFSLVYKILFPLLFSLMPLVLYSNWQEAFGKKFAFISVFLFMAQQTFFTEMLGLNRQIIAELFFVLLLFVILSKKFAPFNKIMCFTIFSFALITSHYGLATIFFFFISAAFIYLFVMKQQSNRLTASMIILFFTLMFLWYLYTSGATVFESITQFGNNVFGQLDEFLNPAARGTTVLRGLGLEAAPTIWNAISRAFAYAIQFLIVVGFVGLLLSRSKSRLSKELFVFTSVAIALLAALLLVPGLANTLNMNRFYHILLIFLAPLCVLGAEFLINKVLKLKREFLISILMGAILVPYFLFQTGFVYEVVGTDSWSISLGKNSMSATRLYDDLGYIDAYNVFSAQWVSKNMRMRALELGSPDIQMYADAISRANVLRSYGLVHVDYVEILSNVTDVVPEGVVYLSTLNVMEGTVPGVRLEWNSSDLGFLYDLNKIYSNGGSEVYKKMP